MGSFEAKNTESKISCLGTFNGFLLQLSCHLMEFHEILHNLTSSFVPGLPLHGVYFVTHPTAIYAVGRIPGSTILTSIP
jgi:hypothetical protein